jgi:alpha-L-fucosidase
MTRVPLTASLTCRVALAVSVTTLYGQPTAPAAASSQARPGVAAPASIGPLPSEAQVRWQRLEYTAFVHFGPNAFTGAEWGTGTEKPGIFNPKELDARQWVRTFKAAGMKGVVVTAKHHDGFCLWPSKDSTHTVAASPWRDGKGDLLRELSDAARAEGLKFGVYLSPWDRNHPTYGTPEYNDVFVRMLEDVLGNYGEIFEVWFDGANGEGPNGKRQVYDWPRFLATVARLQPNAVVFSDAGPGLRWIGNERGEAPITNWALLDRERYEPGTPFSMDLAEGTQLGTHYVPGECDVSIRPGWFWRASEDRRVKSPRTLFRLWEASVGRNCGLLLNVPPDDRGLIRDPDVKALMGFRDLVDRTYGTHVHAGATASADVTRGDGFEAARVLDADPDTYWAAPDPVTKASVTLTLPRDVTFDRVVLQEPIRLGQRIALFEIEAATASGWQRIGTGTTVGHKRIVVVPETTTRQVRVTIHDARATAALSTVSLHVAAGTAAAAPAH